jgi:hypothetical protein
VALLEAWQRQLQQLHQQAALLHGSTGATGQQHQGSQQQQQAVLSLAGFLEVLQEKGVIPRLLEPSDVQEVLRQVMVSQQRQVRGRQRPQLVVCRSAWCLFPGVGGGAE